MALQEDKCESHSRCLWNFRQNIVYNTERLLKS